MRTGSVGSPYFNRGVVRGRVREAAFRSTRRNRRRLTGFHFFAFRPYRPEEVLASTDLVTRGKKKEREAA
jgi:hypothetical protein